MCLSQASGSTESAVKNTHKEKLEAVAHQNPWLYQHLQPFCSPGVCSSLPITLTNTSPPRATQEHRALMARSGPVSVCAEKCLSLSALLQSVLGEWGPEDTHS